MCRFTHIVPVEWKVINDLRICTTVQFEASFDGTDTLLNLLTVYRYNGFITNDRSSFELPIDSIKKKCGASW